MADFVLVHGGQRGGSDWDQVAALLERRGHATFAPTLSRPDESTLGGHVSQVRELIEVNDLEGVVLVGHSYASMVITGVADMVPERIARLVYVDSSVPINGISLYGIFELLGIRSEQYDLPREPPFLEPLYFDDEKIRQIPKTYVHCTRSEFIAVAGPVFEKVMRDAGRDNWDYFELDSGHACMVSHPRELADIFMRET